MNPGPTEEAGAAQLRARRHFRAWFPLSYVPSYLADAVILALFAAAGTVAAWVPVAYFAAGCTSAVVFYALIVSGYSERYSDKFMAWPQVCVASAIMFVFLACAPSVGIIFLGTLFIVGVFGSLRFSWRQTGIMWAMVVLASGAFFYTLEDFTLVPYSSPAEKILVWIWFGLMTGPVDGARTVRQYVAREIVSAPEKARTCARALSGEHHRTVSRQGAG